MMEPLPMSQWLITVCTCSLLEFCSCLLIFLQHQRQSIRITAMLLLTMRWCMDLLLVSPTTAIILPSPTQSSLKEEELQLLHLALLLTYVKCVPVCLLIYNDQIFDSTFTNTTGITSTGIVYVHNVKFVGSPVRHPFPLPYYLLMLNVRL